MDDERDIGRKHLRELRRGSDGRTPPCDDCSERSQCTATCSKLEEYLLATLPGGESVRRADEVLKGLVFKLPARTEEDLDDQIDEARVPRFDDVLDESAQAEEYRSQVEKVIDQLLQGKLTLQGIADFHHCQVEEIIRIKNEVLAILGPDDPILVAIIQQRLTGTMAAKRFNKARSDISRRVSRAARLLTKCGGVGPFHERSFMSRKITVELDELLVQDLETVGGRVKLTASQTVSAMLARWFAERDARRARGVSELLFEFAVGDDGRPFTTGQVYRLIYGKVLSEERRNFEERARLLEAAGQALDDEQKAFLDAEKRQVELRRHLELNKRADALEAARLRVDHPDIPADMPDGLLADCARLIRKGKMSESEFLKVVRNWRAPDDGKGAGA